MIRVVLPQHLRTLAHVDSEVPLEIRGTVTKQRQPFIRFFACEQGLIT